MDVSETKRLQLEQRMATRDENSESVLDSLGLERVDSLGELVDVDGVGVHSKPEPCPVCNGTGKVAGLFRAYDCATCFGTKFDLSNPIAVILWQNACLDWAKREVQQARNELKQASLTPEEAEANAREGFYKDARRID